MVIKLDYISLATYVNSAVQIINTILQLLGDLTQV